MAGIASCCKSKTDEKKENIDVADLERKSAKHSDNFSGLKWLPYPSLPMGVF